MPIMHGTEHLVPHLAHSGTVPFAYHYVCIWKSQLLRLRWALVIFGSGKKDHPWPRTLEGRTWSVKWVRVPDYTCMAHRIKMCILAFPGMCPVYGRYIGPKNRFEHSLNICEDQFRSMLVIWWQLLHTKCFVYGVYTPSTVGRFFIF